MPETNRNNPDASEVFRAQRPLGATTEPTQLPREETPTGDTEERGDEEAEWAGEETGEMHSVMPKRAAMERNSPGAAVAAQKGAVNQFRCA